MNFIPSLLMLLISIVTFAQSEGTGKRVLVRSYPLSKATTSGVNNDRITASKPPKFVTYHCAETLRNLDHKMKLNEDRFIQERRLLKAGLQMNLFGVFDGHGGIGVSQFVARHLGFALQHRLNETIVKYGVYRLSWLIDKFEVLPDDLIPLIKTTLVETIGEIDLVLCEQFCMRNTGSTGSFTLRIRDVAFIVNIGDSRTLVLRNGKLWFRTRDHSPTDPEELNHINEAGGKVIYRSNTYRLNGVLAMSRAFGDCMSKVRGFETFLDSSSTEGCENYDGTNGILRVTPDINHLRLNLSNSTYTFFSATDGLFDSLDDYEVAADIARPDIVSEKPSACTRLVHNARHGGSIDDITSILVQISPSKLKL